MTQMMQSATVQVITNHLLVSLTNSHIAVFIFEKITFSEFKDQIVKRVLMNLPKMRSKIVTCYGDLYWSEVPIERASNLIKEAPSHIHNEEQIDAYLEAILPPRIPSDMP